jgi:hypothetical protein
MQTLGRSQISLTLNTNSRVLRALQRAAATTMDSALSRYLTVRWAVSVRSSTRVRSACRRYNLRRPFRSPPSAFDGDTVQAQEQRRDQEDRVSHGPYSVQLHVELGRTRDRAPVPLHGRTRSGSTVASTSRQVLEQGPWMPHSARRDNTIQPWRIVGDGSVTNANA